MQQENSNPRGGGEEEEGTDRVRVRATPTLPKWGNSTHAFLRHHKSGVCQKNRGRGDLCQGTPERGRDLIEIDIEIDIDYARPPLSPTNSNPRLVATRSKTQTQASGKQQQQQQQARARHTHTHIVACVSSQSPTWGCRKTALRRLTLRTFPWS